MTVKLLSPLQIKGLNKLGDVVCPGAKELPRFSKTNVYQHVDRMLDYMPEEDLSGIKILLGFFAFTPKFIIHLIIKLTEKAKTGLFRLINTALKGIIFTLYYSALDDQGEEIIATLGCQSNILSIPEEEDLLYPFTDEASKMTTLGTTPADTMIRARAAQKEVRELDLSERVNYLREMKEVILDNRSWIIDEIQRENGKSRTDALVSEIFGVLDHLDYLIKYAPKILKDEKIHTPIALLGKKSRIYYEPLGVFLIISPWNYPFYQAIVPITSAFITGNAVIYKPSELTPLNGVLERVLSGAGFEPQWCQIAYGDGELASQLIDQKPNKIFFTGSVATGKKIMAQASHSLTPVELELGGKDPSIVFEDAALERAVRGVLWGGLTCSGQSCTSIEQVFIQSSIYDSFKELLLQEVKKIRIGTPDNDGDLELGRMTTPSQVDIVRTHIEDAISKGATLLSGSEWDKKSDTVPPLILENITEDMLIYNEETFGPILPLISFDSEQEVIEKINQSSFGLSASVWSADALRCERVARSLETGNVSINNIMLTEGNPALPFGGVKNSGIGRYKGAMGLRGFCNAKSIIIDSNSNKVEVNWFPYTSKKFRLFDHMTEHLFRGGIKNFIRFVLTGLQIESYSDKEAKKPFE
jgi:acyl-CoA reductase-like NAD-dependent aldehyde dehydrogenase